MSNEVILVVLVEGVGDHACDNEEGDHEGIVHEWSVFIQMGVAQSFFGDDEGGHSYDYHTDNVE